jgi:polysaccharide pyruvyl transferase WcaK-like protein
LSANKGAAAMVESVVARTPDAVGACEFSLLTTYPDADAPRVPRGGAPVRVVGLEPWRLALVEFPVALLSAILRVLRIPRGWVRTRANRAILDSDAALDVAGISFADGRGVPITVYNALMTGLPLLLGVPTVKLAQALGPFSSQPNKTLAHMVLPRLAVVCARGARTREHLDTLGLSNVVDVADLAFSLDEAGSLPSEIEVRVAAAGDHIVVMPSAVVKKLFERDGNGRQPTYVDAMVELVRELRARTGLSVVVAPHSYRAGAAEGRMNDGPVCREIVGRLADDPGTVLVDGDLTAGELRHLVAGSRVLVTSRFHAMISGLATCTPTVVVGWSHKYREVLGDFGLADFGCDSAHLATPGAIGALVDDCLTRHDEISRQIAAALPSVRDRSLANFAQVAAVVGATGVST